MENSRLKISKKMIALLVAGGLSLAPLGEGLAKTYQEGKFVRLTEEEEELQDYYEYVVKEGDTLSRISEKICSFFKEDITTKYWPTLAFLNDYPRVSQPGDIIKFPKSFEALDALNSALRKKGWTAKYIQNNDIYGTKKKHILSRTIIYPLLEDIYGSSVCVDEDFVRRYLSVHDLDGKYEFTDIDYYDSELLFILTEWIPTLDELGLKPQEKIDKRQKRR